MATLVVKGLTVLRGAQTVLHEVDLTVAPGTRLGVLGPNGVGKSTLLRALAGELTPDAGRREVRPGSATVGLLPQEPDRRPGETVAGLLARRTGVADAEADLEAQTLLLSEGRESTYDEALQRWLDLGGADLEQRAEEVCADLGLDPALLARLTTELSGGQAARASLAAVLLSRFDVLLLDEPTNDLDFAGLDRLEQFMLQRSGALVVVSHDRELLARTVTSVAEVDRHHHGVRTFAGGWEAFTVERERLRVQARERYEDYDDKRQGLVEQAQRQREQSVRGALRAKRKAPDGDRAARGARIEAATHAASRVKAVESNLARLDEVEEPRKEWQLRLSFAPAPRSGDLVATLTGAVVRRGGFTLGPVDLTLGWADRVVVTGANGSGKSTLIAALLGSVELDEGSRTLGAGTRVGGIDQARSAFSGEQTVLRTVELGSGLLTAEARTLLAKLGLAGEHVTRPAASLSPGERTRAGLALLMAQGTNLLVLDEPTNHLDLPAIEQLEVALEAFAGTVLLVTHDRRLLQGVRVSRRWVLEAGAVREEPA